MQHSTNSYFQLHKFPVETADAADAISWNNFQLFTSLFPQVPMQGINSTDNTRPNHSWHTRLELTRMGQVVQELLNQGISPHTAASYQSCVRRLQVFCIQGGLSPFLLTESNLCRSVAYLYNALLSPQSIHQYFSALHFHQIAMSNPDPSMAHFHRLHYVLCGINRICPLATHHLWLLITPAILQLLHQTSLIPAPSHGEEGSGTMRITNLFCWNAEVKCIHLFVMC